MADQAVALASAERRPASPGLSVETTWGLAMTIPYAVIFLLFVVWPVGYGLWMGTRAASYATLWNDPIYHRTLWNTAIFLGVAVNLKLAMALVISGFFVHPQRWIRW